MNTMYGVRQLEEPELFDDESSRMFELFYESLTKEQQQQYDAQYETIAIIGCTEL
jgi:hypothetical protein